MSDKFFFKGRQDTRYNYKQHGFTTNAAEKAGTKKFPLELVVTSEARKKEVEALVDEAKLHAKIIIDTKDDAAESIEDLTALLNKVSTMTFKQTPARNEPCSCGSGKKYKKCCG